MGRKKDEVERKKKHGRIVLLVLVALAILSYVLFYLCWKYNQWKYVRVLTMEERRKVVEVYGPEAASYKYVVIHPVHAMVCGMPVTVREGFLSDGVTWCMALDEVDEQDWLIHDWLYGVQRSDDGRCITKEQTDNVLKLADRRIAAKIYGLSFWQSGLEIGPQFLPL